MHQRLEFQIVDVTPVFKPRPAPPGETHGPVNLYNPRQYRHPREVPGEMSQIGWHPELQAQSFTIVGFAEDFRQ